MATVSAFVRIWAGSSSILVIDIFEITPLSREAPGIGCPVGGGGKRSVSEESRKSRGSGAENGGNSPDAGNRFVSVPSGRGANRRAASLGTPRRVAEMDLPPLPAGRMACCQRQGKLQRRSGSHEVANPFPLPSRDDGTPGISDAHPLGSAEPARVVGTVTGALAAGRRGRLPSAALPPRGAGADVARDAVRDP